MTTVLIVDDRPELMRYLRKAVSSAADVVLEAVNFNEAVERIENNKIDLVITDIVLNAAENKDGFRVLRAAKDKDFKTQVIVITSFGSEKLSVEAMSLGAYDYVERNDPTINIINHLRKLAVEAIEFKKSLG